ncbi:MAG: hypothetical protein ACTHQQ_16475 [Solirubrobacteraceae bacterium]
MRLSRGIFAGAALVATIVTVATCAATPPPASAGIIPEGACKAIGDLNGLGGKACQALSHPERLLKTGKSLISGHIGSAIKELIGSGGGSSASAALGLAAIVAWVVDGARTAVNDMGKVIDETTAPNLGSVWFSSTYWRIAAVSALLTLPFLFAAAVQALVRSDLSLLARAAFGHLPIALVGVGIAAPVTMLLLSGTDEACSLVWSSGSSDGLTSLFAGGGTVIGAVALAGSPFLAFLMCLFTAAAALLVWLELAMREAAVYIVVLLLPLAFAALVWPARRVWAVRVVEILVALILSKFAIVAVLGLGGAALDQAGAHGLSAMLAGMVLVLLAALAPWAVLRLVPLAEVATSAASALRPHAFASLQAAWPSKRTGEMIGRVWGMSRATSLICCAFQITGKPRAHTWRRRTATPAMVARRRIGRRTTARMTRGRAQPNQNSPSHMRSAQTPAMRTRQIVPGSPLTPTARSSLPTRTARNSLPTRTARKSLRTRTSPPTSIPRTWPTAEV